MTEINKWKEFWNLQTSPLHSYNSPSWYKLFADEINLILKASEYTGGAVLETGCGNGALFPYLDINKENYIGIDLSDSLLEIFRKNQPGVNLISGDASSYHSEKRFSLIFSNGVVQYFNKKMLEQYIRNSTEMLEDNGILLLGNLLWKDVSNQYYSGELVTGENIKKPRYPRLKLLKARLWSVFNKNGTMGHAYNPRDFFKYDGEVTVYGSLFHPYRFSVVIKKQYN